MLVNNDFNNIKNDKIYLLPAWPCEWNVKFKLRVKKNTIIEFEYNSKNKEYNLTVIPQERKNDVVFVNCIQ